MFLQRGNYTRAGSLTDLLSDPQTSSTINLIFTYLFTGLTLSFLHRNFRRFVQSRQSFSLHLIHSISSRTVLVTEVPKHLRGDRALADYFENCGWSVESVSVVREVDPLKRVLEKRTNALLQLEGAWSEWVGNPAKGVTGYDPKVYQDKNKRPRPQGSTEDDSLIPGINGDDNDEYANGDVENQQCHSHVHTTRPRPSFRPRTFGTKVDSIEHWEKKYEYADEETRSMRQKGIYEATHAAFVTFEDIKSAVSHVLVKTSIADMAANGMPGCPLPPTFSGHYPTSPRAPRRSLVEGRYPTARETYPKLCRCWLVRTPGTFLDR